MGWYPGARKLELQPESDSQAAIIPTQFILHSIAAPWTVQRIYEYWRDSTNLESHFGLAYDGDLGQFIGTHTRADANASANVRAISLESASNLQHTDPWTPAQLESIVKLGVWLHETEGLPLRVCRTWDDPGYGYHGMFPEWSLGGTACPGKARIDQFWSYIFPEIVRRATPAPPVAPLERKTMADFTEADITRIVKDAVEAVRDDLAFANMYFLEIALSGRSLDGVPYGMAQAITGLRAHLPVK